MSAPIPTILHQTWRDADLPDHFARWRAAWCRLHPDWEHRFHADTDIRRIVSDRAPHLLGVFEALTLPILRVDLFRYLIVYLDGGIYADLDMIPYRPSDALIMGESCVLSVEAHLRPAYQRHLGYRKPYQIANCIFAAAPEHPFFAELIDGIARRAVGAVRRDADVEDMTGPRMLTRLAFDLPATRRGDIRILPQIHWMAPREYPRIGPLAGRIHARHAATGTWRLDSAGRSFREWWMARQRLPNPFAVEGPALP